jgi:hypothetical protein
MVKPHVSAATQTASPGSGIAAPGAPYGTRQAPLSIEQARARIRKDFLCFADLVMSQVALPDGHSFGSATAGSLNHQLTWNQRCEVLSSSSGLSVFGRRAVADDGDEHQLQVEVRYFHPELHFRPTPRSDPRVSRQFNDGFGVHLWVDQGRPFWGMTRSLIAGSEFCSGVSSPEALALEVVRRLRLAIERRTRPAAVAALAD